MLPVVEVGSREGVGWEEGLQAALTEAWEVGVAAGPSQLTTSGVGPAEAVGLGCPLGLPVAEARGVKVPRECT